MIQLILDLYQHSNFDFTQYAFPSDPLRDRFREWQDYYRLKWAIAKAIQPNSILEIGVRFGYSAIAFLQAVPKAHYVGIDIDNNSFGGQQGAIDWAKQITEGYHTDFIIGNTQEMNEFPSPEIYDLIHVDAQQDGDGTYHDLSLATKQARYILVDGLFWTAENFQASLNWVRDNQRHFEYFIGIPGYAGELLIKVKSPSVTTDCWLSNTTDRQTDRQNRQTVVSFYQLIRKVTIFKTVGDMTTTNSLGGNCLILA